MANAVEIANAYISLTVRAPGIKQSVEAELGKVDTKSVGDNMGRTAGKGFSTGFAVVAGAVGGIAATLANTAIGSIGGIIAEARTATDAAMKFKSTLDFAGVDTTTIDSLTASTKAYADATVYDLSTIQSTTAQLASNGVKDYAALTEASGNLNAIAGGNAETFKSVGMVLSQTAGAGKLSAENWNQLADAIPGASGKIQEALATNGAFVGNFRDEMAKGEISSEEFNAALLQLGTDPIAVEAAKSTETFEGALGGLQASAVSVVSAILEDLQPAITGMIGFLSESVDWIGQNVSWLGPLAGGIGIVAAAIGIWTAGQWLLNAALAANPIGIVIGIIAALVAAIVWVATQTTFFQDLWTNVTNVIGAAATWLFETILKPVFEGIGAVFTWLWTTILEPYINAWINVFRFIGAVAAWLWNEAIAPAFRGIAEVVGTVWSWLQQNVFGPIGVALGILGAAFMVLWNTYVSPVWRNIQNAIGSAWNWIRDSVFAPFGTAIGFIGTAFENVASAIATAWDGIKEAAAAPVRFIVDTVWNEGVLKFTNGVFDALGLGDMKMDPVRLGFASGGVMPGYTPGRDVHRFYSPTGGLLDLSGGEAIMRPEFTRLVGGAAGVDALNSAARNGSLGIGDGLGDFAGDVWENIQKAAAVAWDFVSNPAAAIQTHLIDGMIRPLTAQLGDGAFATMASQMPVNLVKGMADLFKAAAPAGPGGAGMGWEAMWNTVKGRFPDATLNSSVRPGAKTVNGGQSYHALGRAIDVPPSMDIFNWIKAAYPNSSELIYSPAGSKQLLNGQEHFWEGAVRAQHFNHVHWAMANGGVMPKLYDQGGWLPHGGMAVNLSGRPEPILTADQWDSLGSGPSELVVVDVNGDLIGRMRVEARDVVAADSSARRRGFGQGVSRG